MVVSLYFHIPFCNKKCPYCHFFVLPNRPALHKALYEGFEREWEQKLPLLQDKTITSVYFGGGTPSLFAPERFGALLERIRRDCTLAKDCEITLEANPEDGGDFNAFRSIGINRMSFGVQSLDDRSLVTLERTHSAKKARSALFLATQSGIENLSIDLMYDLPDQTEASWRYTLDQLPDLPFRHLSLYNLTIEPNTPFYKRKERLSFPDAELSLRLLEIAVEALETLGLERYEISAFAYPGYESRHNKGYWTGRPFLGFGPSAFSYWEGERFRNVAHLRRYCDLLEKGETPVDFREKLPFPKNLQELLAIRLRLHEGAEPPFLKQLPPSVTSILEMLERKGWVLSSREGVRLTDKGRLFYDSVASEIV